MGNDGLSTRARIEGLWHGGDSGTGCAGFVSKGGITIIFRRPGYWGSCGCGCGHTGWGCIKRNYPLFMFICDYRKTCGSSSFSYSW